MQKPLVFGGAIFPETNSKFAPENRPFNDPNGNKKVFQPSIFRCELLVWGVLALFLIQFTRHFFEI